MKNKLSLYKVKFNTTVRLDEFIKDEKKNIYDFKKTLDATQIQIIKKILQNLEFKAQDLSLIDISPDKKKGTTNEKETKEKEAKETKTKIEEADQNGYKPNQDISPFLIDFIKNRPLKPRKFVFKEDQEREEKNQRLMMELNNFKTITLIKKINIIGLGTLYLSF